MSGHFCDPCAFEECQWRSNLVVSCPRFIPEPETRYEKLFGTPERAALTLTHVCQFTHGGELCDRCRCYLFGDCDGTLRLRSERSIYDALLEWLRGDGVEV